MINPRKKLKISFILILFLTSLVYAQNSQIEEKSVSKKFSLNGLSPSLILSRAESWFENEDNGEKNVVETLSLEKRELIVKGETKVLYKNIGKELYPKRSGMAEVLDAYFGHMIEVHIDEDTYSEIKLHGDRYEERDVWKGRYIFSMREF